MKNRPLVIIILVALITGYFSYYFLQRQVFVKTRNADETEYRTEIYNPISKIFLGRISLGESSFRQFQVLDRITSLLDTASIVCLLVAAYQYFRSRTRKYKFLLFMMVTEMYLVIAGVSSRLFYWIYNLTAPESNLFTSNSISLWWGLRYALLLSALSILITLLLNPYDARMPENKQPKVPFKWMRPFHYVTDRLIIVMLGMNGFVFYFLNRSTTELDGNELYLWAVISVTGCVIIATFVTESLFQISPSKILTGSFVVSENVAKPSTGNIAVRSVARIIPFNSISFLGKKGWHDSLSKTTVVYADEESWLGRQTRLVTGVFSFGIIVLALLVVTNVMTTIDPFHFSDLFALPYALAPLTLLMMALVLTCWLASLSNFCENLYNGNATESPVHFWTTLALWVPLLNFKTTAVLLNDISHNLGTMLTDDEQKQDLEHKTSRLKTAFVILNIVIILAALLWTSVTYRIEFMIVIAMLSFALLYWSYTIIRYAKFIRTISANLTHSIRAGTPVRDSAAY